MRWWGSMREGEKKKTKKGKSRKKRHKALVVCYRYINFCNFTKITSFWLLFCILVGMSPLHLLSLTWIEMRNWVWVCNISLGGRLEIKIEQFHIFFSCYGLDECKEKQPFCCAALLDFALLRRSHRGTACVGCCTFCRADFSHPGCPGAGLLGTRRAPFLLCSFVGKGFGKRVSLMLKTSGLQGALSFLLMGTERFSSLGRIQLFHTTIPYPSPPQLSYKNIHFLGLMLAQTLAPGGPVASTDHGLQHHGHRCPRLCAMALCGCQGWFSTICSFCHDGLYGDAGGVGAFCRSLQEEEALPGARCAMRGTCWHTSGVLPMRPTPSSFCTTKHLASCSCPVTVVCTQGDAETGCPLCWHRSLSPDVRLRVCNGQPAASAAITAQMYEKPEAIW